MSLQNKAFNAPLFILVSVLAFGTGLVIVTASQKSTENRSKASSNNGPYFCDAACSPASGGVGGQACLACMGSLPKDGETCNTNYTTNMANDCENCPGKKWYAHPTTGQILCGTMPVVPTPEENPWADCAQWGADGACNFTYWQKQEAAENDWRCKDLYLFLDMCEFSTGPQEMPTEPRPEEDPGLNPGEETF